MHIQNPPTRFIWGLAIDLWDFPNLARAVSRKCTEPSQQTHDRTDRTAGSTFDRSRFLNQGLQAFIRVVCHWGGYAGIGGRVIKSNGPRKREKAFRRAHKQLIEGNAVEARTLRELSGLGVSFASKHLKLLAP